MCLLSRTDPRFAKYPRLPVLSYSELSGQLQVETMGVIALAQTADV